MNRWSGKSLYVIPATFIRALVNFIPVNDVPKTFYQKFQLDISYFCNRYEYLWNASVT